jgi:glycosyltransferase involved in cell wall biosynthesis
VDLEIFNVKVPPERRVPKVLWVGSENHRRLKGYDQVMCPVRDALAAEGIDCELLLVDSYDPSKRTPAEMADWYNAGTVLVCASGSEGTPNPALEAAACGCTVVATPVGNMPQLIRNDRNGYLVDQDVGAILEGVKMASTKYLRLAGQMQEDIQAWSWAERAPRYFEVFRRTLRGATSGEPGALDELAAPSIRARAALG